MFWRLVFHLSGSPKAFDMQSASAGMSPTEEVDMEEIDPEAVEEIRSEIEERMEKRLEGVDVSDVEIETDKPDVETEADEPELEIEVDDSPEMEIEADDSPEVEIETGELQIDEESLPSPEPAVSVESLGNYSVEEEGYRFDFQTVTRGGRLEVEVVVFKEGHQGPIYRDDRLPNDVADALGVSRSLQSRVNGLLSDAGELELPEPLQSNSQEQTGTDLRDTLDQL